MNHRLGLRLKTTFEVEFPINFQELSEVQREEVANILAELCKVPVERRLEIATWVLSATIQARLFDREPLDALINGVT